MWPRRLRRTDAARTDAVLNEAGAATLNDQIAIEWLMCTGITGPARLPLACAR